MNEGYHKHHHHRHHHRHHSVEAVTVCVGYHDFLAESIKYNNGLFDRWIVVTSPDDSKTRELCRKYSVHALVSEDHLKDGEGAFNKGSLIERGLQHLSADGWRLHLDSDIILPRNFRNIIQTARLNPANIYGADRLMVKSREQWENLQKSGWVGNDYHCRVDFPTNHDVGSRWAHKDEGYCPIGFFQMWHSSEDLYKGARVKPYPTNHNDACRTDVQFSLQWDRTHRMIIPELIVVHLESEAAPLGANWNGRKTKPF
jgi:hypothetical protein